MRKRELRRRAQVMADAISKVLHDDHRSDDGIGLPDGEHRCAHGVPWFRECQPCVADTLAPALAAWTASDGEAPRDQRMAAARDLAEVLGSVDRSRLALAVKRFRAAFEGEGRNDH